jgi:hypothetical protein
MPVRQGKQPTSILEMLLSSKKNGGALNFGSPPHRHLMQGKAQVKLANRASRLCDDPVGEKILGSLVFAVKVHNILCHQCAKAS